MPQSAIVLMPGKQYVVAIKGVGVGKVEVVEARLSMYLLKAVTRFGLTNFCCGDTAGFDRADVAIKEAL